ncbi:hybrid sensor histidine kinase/response regulator [Lusitaniella coriacea]|uniref:hybrid sensor histidine kinase/response regulator n=1 Tax=Lusitaniella coriacea TaxID=1983105 RepID=UPI003CF082AF
MNSPQTSKILIVDDSRTNVEVLSDALTNAGYMIEIAQDGKSALQQAQEKQPDLILLDVQMPGIDGFETCHQLKENRETQNIPVIFTTAMTDITNKVKGLNLGAVDYIIKPFQPEEVLARVKVHLQLRQMTKTLAQQNIQLQEFKEALEQKVAERTVELQNAQVQLVQQEKLSTLGQLVAGVAHEVNNPLTFLVNNLSPAREYIADITKVLHLYQQHYPDPDSEIEEVCDAVDLEFALEDLPKILNSMRLGTERIRDITVSLRNFSRSDTDKKIAVDIHEGLDSTLLILRHRLKAFSDRAEIEVRRNYNQLPKIKCYPGQLNQVFTNILSNAIDVLEEALEAERMTDRAPEIRICTEKMGEQFVTIRITDNGLGMTEHTQKHLFEPMFTTKAIGKGTGLGLSISQQIVEEKHGGELTCYSVLGQGTEFVIKIPMN